MRELSGVALALLLVGLLVLPAGPQEPVPSVERVAVYDTIRVTETVYDTVQIYTARVVVYDTVQVMHVVRDTIQVERLVTVYDTVQTVADAVGERDLGPLVPIDHVEKYLTDIEEGIISEQALAMIHREIPAFTTVAVGALDSLQLVLIASAFEVQPSEIARFRWAPSVAPPEDANAESVSCAIWLARADTLRHVVMRIAASGKIVGRDQR